MENKAEMISWQQFVKACDEAKKVRLEEEWTAPPVVPAIISTTVGEPSIGAPAARSTPPSQATAPAKKKKKEPPPDLQGSLF